MDIAILDFGSQYTNLIRALLDDLGVSNEVLPNDTSREALGEYRGVVISGGPASVYDARAPRGAHDLFDLDLPILGICYGHQLMAHALGGDVESGRSQEYGRSSLKVLNPNGIFEGLRASEAVWMSHSDTVIRVPEGFTVAAMTDSCPVAAMYNAATGRFGVQFHPEVSQTEAGAQIIKGFLATCGCQINPDTGATIQRLSAQINLEVGDKNVLLLLSGGVDSNVAFMLLVHALRSERVYGLHIDTGLLRNEETAGLVNALAKLGLSDRLRIVDGSETFFARLRGITDAEQKRQVVATTFLDVKDQAMSELKLDPEQWLLGQGTIYTDLITSGLTSQSKKIKTHHNSLLKERENLTIVEPLKVLYKHQVREIGTRLGLPAEMVHKEPYPGPGNSVRILGEVSRQRADLQRQVDAIVTSTLRKYGYDKLLFQGFPVLGFVGDFDLPRLDGSVVGATNPQREEVVRAAGQIVRECLATAPTYQDSDWQVIFLPFSTVGIKGDNRSFATPLVLRFNTPSGTGRVEFGLLEMISSRITNGINDVTRVTYDLTRAKPTESQWDNLAFLRLITSREAMTVDWAKVEYDVLDEMSDLIIRDSDVDRVMLDVTQKPPGMVEWE